MALGAAGLTCATTREAEEMSAVAGDILVAYPPVGTGRLRRLLSLPPDLRLTVALDSAQAVRGLAEAARCGASPRGRLCRNGLRDAAGRRRDRS